MNHTRNYLILGIVIAALVWVTMLNMKANIDLSDKLKESEQAYIDLNHVRLDTSHTTTPSVTISQDEINRMVGEAVKGQVKGIVSTKYNVVNDFKTITHDSVVVRIVDGEPYIDTIQTFYYNDGYLYINCDLDEDTSYCNYSYSDSVTAITYLRKNYKWWQFKKKRLFADKYSALTDVIFRNPNVKIKSVKSVVTNK